MRKKNTYAVMKSLVILLMIVPAVSAQEPIRSASEYNYPPFSIVHDDGESAGFSVDLLRASLNRVGENVSFYAGAWSDINEDLKNGKIQVLPLVGRTPEREAYYDFTVPYITLYGAVFVRKGTSDIRSIQDLHDKSIIVMKGDSAEEFARRENISQNIITTTTYDEAFKKLSGGEHDAVITQKITGDQLLESLEINNIVSAFRLEDFRQDFTFAVKKGDSDLLAKLNEGLSMVVTDGTYDLLHSKWFPETISQEYAVEQKKPEFEYAKSSIRQRSMDIAKQIELYLLAYPDKTLNDLKKDMEFQKIAVQPVGETGYTFVYDCNTMVNHFHFKEAFLGLNHLSLKDEPGREAWWKITEPTMGCKEDYGGTYQWKDPDGVFRDKYKYATIVPARTADNVTLAISASTYLSEYQTHDKKVSLVAPEYPPYDSVHLPNYGFFTEIIVESYHAMGYEVDVDIRPWTYAYNEAKNGTYDGLMHAWYTQEREKWFLYSDELPPTNFVFCTRKNSPVNSFTGYAALTDYTIGTVKDYAYPQSFMDYDFKTKEVITDIENIQSLFNGTVDLIIIDWAQMKYYVEENFSDKSDDYKCLTPIIDSVPAHLVIPKATDNAHQKLIDFNIGFKRIKSDGTYNEILSKHGYESIYAGSSGLAKSSFEELSIELKALEVAKQVDSFLLDNPSMTINDLQKNRIFNEIALQKVGETGYTAILDSETGLVYFHPQQQLIGTNAAAFKDQLPRFWKIFESSIGSKCTESGGYYDWIEEDGTITEKYLYVACASQKTADGKKLVVAATSYLDEITAQDYLKKYRIEDQQFKAVQRFVQEKAEDVAAQLDEYMKRHPNKNINDLQNNPYFKSIAIQAVGKEGYTAVHEHDTLINRFHVNPEIVDSDLHLLKDTLPEFFEIIERNKGGTPAQGVYDWKEANGSIRQKYMYIAVVNASTADGKGLSVAATAYIDDFQDIEDAYDFPQIYFIYIAVGLLGVLLYIFLLSSIYKAKNKALYYRYIVLVLSSLVLLITYMLDLMSIDVLVIVWSERILYCAALMLIFSFLQIILALTNTQLKKYQKVMLYSFLFALLLVILFTNRVVEGAFLIAGKYSSSESIFGDWYNIITGSMFVFILLSLYYLIKAKTESAKRFVYVFLGLFVLLILNVSYYMVLGKSAPFLLMLSPMIFNLLIAYAFFKDGFLKYRANNFIIISSAGLIMILALFIFNTYHTSQDLQADSIESFQEHQLLIAQSNARAIERSLNHVINDAVTSVRLEKGFVSNFSEQKDVVYKTYERLKGQVERIQLLDASGSLTYEIPEDRTQYDAFNYSNQTAVQKALQTPTLHIAVKSMDKDTEKSLSIFVPIHEGGSMHGLLKLDVSIDKLLNILSDIQSDLDADHEGKEYAYLIIDGNAIINSTHVASVPDERITSVKEKEYAKHIGQSIDPNRNSDVLSVYYPLDIGQENWVVAVETEKSAVLVYANESINRIWFSTFGIMIGVVLLGIAINFILTKALRQAVDNKTNEIQKINERLEDTIAERTQELKKASEDLANLNDHLESEVQSKTLEIQEKLEREEKTTQAMIYILERMKKVNQELDESHLELKRKNEEVQAQSEEVQSANEQLLSAEEELRRLNMNLESQVAQRTKEIRELLKVKTEFINQVSHDLRTPLTPILTLLPLVSKRIKNKENKKRIDVAYRNAQYLKILVEDTLNLAKLESGKIDYNMQVINLAEIIYAILSESETLLDKYNISVANNIKKSTHIFADAVRLREVLENIVMNAIKAMPKGGKLTFSAKQKGEYVTIGIKDTGTGFSEAQKKKLFDEFFKADSSRHEFTSSGLGLTICKRMIMQMGGKIWAQSQGKGEGAEFYVRLRGTAKH